ncbi:3-isopropylmalate dehydratase large subunit [Elioraea rosea]|uniref:3-isopropylmalate dehydratase large subunit n=1 Tax=Elioraea rosea TaxID=2492390 RepID=UPI001182A0BC|nr:3-isopropylmalate dehydratase large subunit [Elioraea rosea]
MSQTLLDRLWTLHRIAPAGGGQDLIHIDRILLHDLSGARALTEVAEKGYAIPNPNLAFATPDHAVSSAPGRTAETFPKGAGGVHALRAGSAAHGIRLFDLGQDGQGIVHVMGPELGIVLPGLSVICGDSHTCTNGGLGALAFGVGSSELAHALATQTLRIAKPRAMRVRFEGRFPEGTTAKDAVLAAIGRLGTGAGAGFAVEWGGEAVRALPVEARLTLCNLTIEMGARMGFIAPDDTTFDWVAGRDHAPRGAAWDEAVAHWRTLRSDEDAVFDADHVIDAATIAPQVSWGTSPEHVIAVDAPIPDPDAAPDAQRRKAWQDALAYQGLEPGRPLAGTAVDWVFIGSCTNSRLSDLREAARVVRGRRVADGVTAWVVPGSVRVKRAAEAEGLDRVFTDAGFAWREPGCSLCVAANGEAVPPGARCVSTSNRNFVGRQGKGARTHLASPAMAAAAAVAGRIVDIRKGL